MKTTAPNDGEEALSRSLKSWRVNDPLPPQFQKAVWRRINASQPEVSSSVWELIAKQFRILFVRPAIAASYVTLLLVLGLSAGWMQARQENVRVHQQLSDRYVRVLDPYQASRQ